MIEFKNSFDTAEYKIGSISKLFGIPAETLRYYESLGILEPKKDAETGYRSYTPWEVNTLTLCRLCRSFGFSLTDTQKMLHEDTFEELFARYVQREAELVETIRHYQRLLHLLAAQRSALVRAERGVGRFSVEDSPELLFLHHRYCYELDLSDEVTAVSPQWIDAMPAVNLGFEVLAHTLEKCGFPFELETEKYAKTLWGLSVPVKDADQFGLKLEYPVRYIAPRKSLHTVLATGGKGTLLGDFAEKVLAPIQHLGAKPDGNAVGQVIAYTHQDGQIVRYCDVWVPIR